MDSAEAYRKRRQAEVDAGREINHIGTRETEFMSDRHCCSCGWKSTWYQDGAEYAMADWVVHIQQHGAEVNYPEKSFASGF